MSKGSYAQAYDLAFEAELWIRLKLFKGGDEVDRGVWSKAINTLLDIQKVHSTTETNKKIKKIIQINLAAHNIDDPVELDSILGRNNSFTIKAWYKKGCREIETREPNPKNIRIIFDKIKAIYGVSSPLYLHLRMVLFDQLRLNRYSWSKFDITTDDADEWIQAYDESGLTKGFDYMTTMNILAVYYHDQHKYAKSAIIREKEFHNSYKDATDMYPHTIKRCHRIAASELGDYFVNLRNPELATKWYLEEAKIKQNIEATDSLPILDSSIQNKIKSISGWSELEFLNMIESMNNAITEYNPISTYAFNEFDFTKHLTVPLAYARYYATVDSLEKIKKIAKHPIWNFTDSISTESPSARQAYLNYYLEIQRLLAEVLLMHNSHDNVTNSLQILQDIQTYEEYVHILLYNFFESIQKDIAKAHLFLDNQKECANALTKCWNENHKFILSELYNLNADYRADFINNNSDLLHNLIPTAALKYHSDSIISCIAYDNALLTKGLLLNTEFSVKHNLIGKYGEEARTLFYNINDLKEKRTNNTSPDHIAEINRKIHELERQISNLTLNTSNNSINLAISWQDIFNQLKPDEAAIEFVHVKGYDYIAIIITPRQKHPIIVPISYDKINDPISSLAEQIYKNIWLPLEKYIKDSIKIYISPDGDIYRTPIEYAKMPDGSLISDKYHIRRLSSSREICIKQPSHHFAGQVVLFGGINYDFQLTDKATSNRFNNRSANQKNPFLLLPATKEEVEEIGLILDNINVPNEIISGDDATEQKFRNISKAPVSLMHIATHGYYNEDSIGVYTPYTTAINNEEERCLNNAGLVLAGANWIFNTTQNDTNPPEQDDGIITPYEIACLDFSSVDFVVLSACQTGLGNISPEGVAGLQRGFKKAGAKTILMSLWPVNDIATYMLMRKFYEELSLGNDKYTSLNEARKYLQSTNEYNDAKYWAAFIILD